MDYADALAGLRVLLVGLEPSEASRWPAALRRHGAIAEATSSTGEALRLLRMAPPDAVVLAIPLADADWVGAAAATKEGPEPPILVLLDRADLALGLGGVLPADRLPDAVVCDAKDVDKVIVALAEAMSRQVEPPVPPEQCLPALLVALRDNGESGVLEIRAEGVCTRLILRGGSPVFAEGGALRETLGRMLLRRGTLSEADYVRVIERMTERLIENEATRMGEVLIELGLLTPAEVFEALSAQVREKIVSCFRWPLFHHQFDPVDELSPDVLAYACPPLEALVLAGLRAHFEQERLEPLLAPLAQKRLVLAGEARELAARFRLTPPEQRLLQLVDGSRSCAGVQTASPLGALHTAQVLAALALAKGLVWDEVPAATPPTARPAAGSPETTRGPAARPEPPPTRPTRVGGAPAALERLTRQLARAGRPAAAPRDPRSDRLEAERHFRQGLALLEQSAFPGALRSFTQACERNGEEPEYHLLEAWTQYLLAKDDEARSLARAKVVACAERTLARDREAVRAHAILGQIALAGGELDTAERHFRAVLRVAPEDRGALRGLRLVGRRRAGG
jgi:tetratricopeptide (TPR) repeat protein